MVISTQDRDPGVPSATTMHPLILRQWNKNLDSQDWEAWISLMVQWLRIHLPSRGHGFDTWSRKIPHAAGQLSPCSTATEPVLQLRKPMSPGAHTLQQGNPLQWEACIPQLEIAPTRHN